MSSDAPDKAHRDRIRTQHAETLFVEAGAGTGKTTALVARVVDMVATGYLADIGGLVAITFTENAAAELRSRVREALEAGARDGPHDNLFDQERRRRCQDAVELIDDAAITTLHGFAARILSEAPVEAGLPPGFTVADTMGTGDAGDHAWRDFLDDLLEDEAVRDHLLAGLTLGLKLNDLRTVASALAQSWDRLLDHPLRVRPLPAIAARQVLEFARAALRDSGRWPDGDKLTEHLVGDVTNHVKDLESLEHPMDLLEALSRANFSCSYGQRIAWTKAGLDKATVIDALKAADAARAAVLDAAGAAATETLASRIQDWLLREADRRRLAGTLDYHDLLVLARDVLRGDPEVRRRLHERWPVLLIDEFQDTDPLQVEIACLLAGRCTDDSPASWRDIPIDAGRLFFVGDPKQSIYRFRRADLKIFDEVSELHAGGRTSLSVNFRSVPGILDAANHAFAELFGKDSQPDASYEALVAYRAASDANPPVRLLGGPQAEGNASELRQLEAIHLADVIVRAKREGWPVGVEPRPASYQDMAILLPTRTPLPALERVLAARDIPYRVESRSLVWSTDAVRDLVTLLQAIDNPADEVALLASLRHPGLACSDVDLVNWRAAGGRWSLFAAPPDGVDEQHPVAAALATLRDWHDRRWWMSANELVENVVRELRLVELTSVQRRPRDHWRRLRFLLDQCRAWCDAGGSGLGGFVAWAVQQIENDADVLETVVPESDDDSVRILTIHGAKGLEFPITMVAGLATAGRQHERVLWTDSGPSVQFRAGKLEMVTWKGALAAEKTEADGELTRLLYVALTRAMDHLIIGCYHKPPKGGKGTSAQQLWKWLEGPLTSVERTVSGVDEVAQAAETTPSTSHLLALPDLPDRQIFAGERAGLLDAIAERVATSPTALASASAVDPLDDALNAAPTAPTVTNPPQRRGSSRGAAIGTAVHRVLELVDLQNPGVDEVRRLAQFACAEEDIPQLAKDIEGRVWTALGADVVRDAAQGGRTWREVYVVVKDGERYVEGYIDLLADGADGLAVVDYKTDRADTPAEIAAKEQQYGPQLAAYAKAVEQVTGQAPESATLVFARPSSTRATR